MLICSIQMTVCMFNNVDCPVLKKMLNNYFKGLPLGAHKLHSEGSEKLSSKYYSWVMIDGQELFGNPYDTYRNLGTNNIRAGS